MTQDKVNSVALPAIGSQVPGKQVLYADDQVIEIELDQFHQSLQAGLDVHMTKYPPSWSMR